MLLAVYNGKVDVASDISLGLLQNNKTQDYIEITGTKAFKIVVQLQILALILSLFSALNCNI